MTTLSSSDTQNDILDAYNDQEEGWNGVANKCLTIEYNGLVFYRNFKKYKERTNGNTRSRTSELQNTWKMVECS